MSQVFKMELTKEQVDWVIRKDEIEEKHEESIDNLNRILDERDKLILELAEIVGYNGVAFKEEDVIISRINDIRTGRQVYYADELISMLKEKLGIKE